MVRYLRNGAMESCSNLLSIEIIKIMLLILLKHCNYIVTSFVTVFQFVIFTMQGRDYLQHLCFSFTQTLNFRFKTSCS